MCSFQSLWKRFFVSSEYTKDELKNLPGMGNPGYCLSF